LIFFIFDYIFLNLKKKFSRVKLSLYHMDVTEWCGNDNDTCHLYVRCHFYFLNFVPLF